MKGAAMSAIFKSWPWVTRDSTFVREMSGSTLPLLGVALHQGSCFARMKLCCGMRMAAGGGCAFSANVNPAFGAGIY